MEPDYLELVSKWSAEPGKLKKSFEKWKKTKSGIGDFKKAREAETKEATTDFELGLAFLLKFWVEDVVGLAKYLLLINSALMTWCHGRVAQSVERPKGPSLVQLYRTDVGSNPGRGKGVRKDCRWKIPSHAICVITEELRVRSGGKTTMSWWIKVISKVSKLSECHLSW